MSGRPAGEGPELFEIVGKPYDLAKIVEACKKLSGRSPATSR
jgi:hypothetical protein